jgi:hypothetical protein
LWWWIHGTHFLFCSACCNLCGKYLSASSNSSGCRFFWWENSWKKLRNMELMNGWWAWGDLQVCRLLWRRRCSKSKVGKASSVLQNTRCLSPWEWVCTASGGHPCAGRYAANEGQILD